MLHPVEKSICKKGANGTRYCVGPVIRKIKKKHREKVHIGLEHYEADAQAREHCP